MYSVDINEYWSTNSDLRTNNASSKNNRKWVKVLNWKLKKIGVLKTKKFNIHVLDWKVVKLVY
jgi:hypothetical protein